MKKGIPDDVVRKLPINKTRLENPIFRETHECRNAQNETPRATRLPTHTTRKNYVLGARPLHLAAWMKSAKRG